MYRLLGIGRRCTMISARGKRDKLPKLLYTVPSRSNNYVGPICINYSEWERMKATLNKSQILAQEQADSRAVRENLHEKSVELMKNWPDAPSNLHAIRRQKVQQIQENEGNKLEKLSQAEQNYQNELKRTFLEKAHRQLLCSSEKGRILAKALLAAAGDKECENQREMKQKQLQCEKLLQQEYEKALIQSQESYLQLQKNKEAERKRELAEYYKDIDKLVKFRNEIKARQRECHKIEDETNHALLNMIATENSQMKSAKKACQLQVMAGYEKQIEEQKLLKKYRDNVEKYEDMKIQTFEVNKTETKRKTDEFLLEQERLRALKKKKVYDIIEAAKQKIETEDKSEVVRIQVEREKNSEYDKRLQVAKERDIAYGRDTKIQRDNFMKEKNEKKTQAVTEEIEERLIAVEDAKDCRSMESQVSKHKRDFIVAIKICQSQQIAENEKRKQNEKILQNLREKHLEDSRVNYDAEISKFADGLVEFAKGKGWPTRRLSAHKVNGKWCDEDPALLRFRGPSPALCNRAIKLSRKKP